MGKTKALYVVGLKNLDHICSCHDTCQVIFLFNFHIEDTKKVFGFTCQLRSHKSFPFLGFGGFLGDMQNRFLPIIIWSCAWLPITFTSLLDQYKPKNLLYSHANLIKQICYIDPIGVGKWSPITKSIIPLKQILKISDYFVQNIPLSLITSYWKDH